MIPRNAVVQDGTLILAITKEGATGFSGTVPMDDGSGGTVTPNPRPTLAAASPGCGRPTLPAAPTCRWLGLASPRCSENQDGDGSYRPLLPEQRYHRAVSRARPPATAFARHLGAVASLAFLAGGCRGGVLDAGRNNDPPDACANRDAPSPGCTPTGPLDNLVGHWRLDDGTGSAVAFDSSGRANDGALHGLDPSTAWVSGRSLGALNTAHAGWVQVAHSPSIDAIVDRITVCAWINQQTHDHRRGQIRDGAVTPDRDERRPVLSPVAAPRAADPVHHHQQRLRDAHGRRMSARDTWIHLAGVYDGAAVRLYVNGAEVASESLTGSLAPDTTPVILGGNGNDASGVPTELFPGRIDELMLYARALSAEEIARLAAGALFPGGATDAGAD